ASATDEAARAPAPPAGKHGAARLLAGRAIRRLGGLPRPAAFILGAGPAVELRAHDVAVSTETAAPRLLGELGLQVLGVLRYQVLRAELEKRAHGQHGDADLV